PGRSGSIRSHRRRRCATPSHSAISGPRRRGAAHPSDGPIDDPRGSGAMSLDMDREAPMRSLMMGVAAAALMAGGAQAKVLAVAPGGDAPEKVQTALLDAKPGDVVQLAAGRYELTDGLSLDVAGVTVKG